MQKRGATQKGFLVAVFLVLVAVVGVSYLSPGSTGKAIDISTSGEGSAGEDICPNPKSSEKACVDNVLCVYDCNTGMFKDRYLIASSSAKCPPRHEFCSLQDSRSISAGGTCLAALRALESKEPGSCSNDCSDKGVITSEDKDAECCTVTKERNCVPLPEVR